MSRKAMKDGRLLSKYIRRIAEENTEFLKAESPSDDDRMATKAEALARNLWREALGWEEVIITGDDAKKVIHPPNARIAFLLMDRMEGRAPTAVDDTDDKPSTAKKVTEQGLKRIADAGGLKNNGHSTKASA